MAEVRVVNQVVIQRMVVPVVVLLVISNLITLVEFVANIIVMLIEPFQRKVELVAQFRNIKGPAAVVGVLCTLLNHVIDDLFYFFSAHNPYSFCCSNIRLSGPVASHAGIEPTVQPMLMTQIKEPQISPGLSCAYSSGVQ